MLRTQARKRKIDIKSIIPEDPILLKGNPNDLWQILMNIILNAIQAIKDGGMITISLAVSDHITSEERSKYSALDEYTRFLKLTVIDTGPGISNEHLGKIFKPFYTTKEDGSGLGLAIVKRIIDGNNWLIDVNSTQDSGTEFIIMIPSKAT
jgi:signal transduction histidine kinase